MAADPLSPSLPESPPFTFLKSENHRGRLVTLRANVGPILGVNVFRHFTDHSVTHSDNVARNVDKLIEPLQITEHRLSNDELLILYSACYLHDVGMQYENAGTTEVIKALKPGPQWTDLSEDDKLEIVRQQHNCISAELVRRSTKESSPPIGTLLTDEYFPSKIAALCEAHCVTPSDDRYGVLMGETPHIRMPLLSGILRLADILDESCHRAQRQVARSLNMPLNSQLHWFRHYYTRGVTFDPLNWKVVIHYEFPSGDQFKEYNEVIPQLQLPWIHQEFAHHVAAFSAAGLHWWLSHKATFDPYSTLESMPSEVLLAMLKEVHNRAQREKEQRRQIALGTFKAARPYIDRQLNELKAKKERLQPAEYLEELVRITQSLWEIGSTRSACVALAFEFERTRLSLPAERQVEIGTQLLTMLLKDEDFDLIRSWLPQLLQTCKSLPHSKARQKFLRLGAEALMLQCGYPEAITAFEYAIRHETDPESKKVMAAQIAEMHLLQGELAKALESEGVA